MVNCNACTSSPARGRRAQKRKEGKERGANIRTIIPKHTITENRAFPAPTGADAHLAAYPGSSDWQGHMKPPESTMGVVPCSKKELDGLDFLHSFCFRLLTSRKRKSWTSRRAWKNKEFRSKHPPSARGKVPSLFQKQPESGMEAISGLGSTAKPASPLITDYWPGVKGLVPLLLC